MAKHHEHFLHDRLSLLGLPAGSTPTAWTPNTDVYETCGMLIVRLEIAGIQREDVEITVHDRLVVVRGHRKDPCRQERCSFRQMEVDYGYFERRIVIPRSVDSSQVRARFDNGFLTIELPKSPATAHATVTVIIEQAD